MCHSPASAEEPVEEINTPHASLHADPPSVQTQENLENLSTDTRLPFESSAIFNGSAVESQNPEFLTSGATYPPGVTSHIDEAFCLMGQSFGYSNNLDPWNNDVFSFNNVIPARYLDTDISLCDLFQQFPPAQPASEYTESARELEPVVQSQTQSVTFAEETATQNPPLPPRFPSTDDQLHHSNLDAGSDTSGCPWILSASAYRQISEKLAENKSVLPDFKLPSKFTLIRYLEGYFCGFHDTCLFFIRQHLTRKTSSSNFYSHLLLWVHSIVLNMPKGISYMMQPGVLLIRAFPIAGVKTWD